MDELRGALAQFRGQPLRGVLYFRPPHDAGLNLNHPAAHDVGLAVEFTFDTGHFFLTWHVQSETGIHAECGRAVDYFREGVFEDVSTLVDWQTHIGQPLTDLEFLPNYAAVSFGPSRVYVVTAEIDRQHPAVIDGMADNLVVFFGEKRLQAFLTQYGLT